MMLRPDKSLKRKVVSSCPKCMVVTNLTQLLPEVKAEKHNHHQPRENQHLLAKALQLTLIWMMLQARQLKKPN